MVPSNPAPSLTRKAVAIISGGMDSATLAYLLLKEGYDLQLLSFDYGQRHNKELQYAAQLATTLGVPWSLIDLTSVTRLLPGSSLTDPTVTVPHGHYSNDTMRDTVVPNRNAMMLSLAYAVAVAQKAARVAFGAHRGDHDVYPDCRREFVEAIDHALAVGNEGFADPDLTIIAPFIDKTKSDIVLIGARLGVPFEKTWSCYEGGTTHCGKCGTCVERREAFYTARVDDPTTYAVPWEVTQQLLQQTS